MRLNRDLRYQIKALLDAGLLQKDIANQLKISPGALTKELRRNGGLENQREIESEMKKARSNLA